MMIRRRRLFIERLKGNEGKKWLNFMLLLEIYLIPVEFIQGNHSVSVHMKQAVRYIKQMEENVKELNTKRNELKKFIKTNESSSTKGLRNRVSVRNCNGGVHILIDSCLIEDGFVLSGVLNTLVEEGLNVTTCTLTKVKDCLCHSIQAEACDLSLIGLSMLEKRLILVANVLG